MEKTTNICDCCDKAVGTIKCPICSNDCCDRCTKECTLQLFKMKKNSIFSNSASLDSNKMIIPSIKICEKCFYSIVAIDFSLQEPTIDKILEILKNAIALAKINDTNQSKRTDEVKKQDELDERRVIQPYPNGMQPLNPNPFRPMTPKPVRPSPNWNKYYYSKTSNGVQALQSQKSKGGIK